MIVLKIKNIKSDISQYVFYLIMVIIVFVYLFFPGNNPFSEDSISYANNVKYGEDLFKSHHLLYNAFNYYLFTSLKLLTPSLDAYRFMQLVNGVFGLLCLFVFRKIVIQLSGDIIKANIWTFFTASCFGVMRFSVEIETYIIPIFFSLLSSLFYFKFLKTEKICYILFCSLMASTACLFHQIHLFWGIGLFVGFLTTRKIKQIISYALPTVSVLIVYSIVMTFYTEMEFSLANLWLYLADYYYSVDAEIGIGLSNFILTPISFFRTFFQVHGIIVDILHLMPLCWMVIPIVLIFVGFGVFSLKGLKTKQLYLSKCKFETTHLLIFILQFTFAFFSEGNAEFMVMLPFLIPMFIHSFLDFDLKVIKYFSIGMLIWNFCFSVFPNHYFDYYNDSQLLCVIKENPDKAFILLQRNVVLEKYYYYTGDYEDDRLIHSYREDDILRLKSENKTFYTDFLSKKMPLNRDKIIHDWKYDHLFLVKHIKRINADLGTFFIDEVNIEYQE